MVGLKGVGVETAEPAQLPGEPPRPGMVWIPGGTFRMGSDRHYPEEAPFHQVRWTGSGWIVLRSLMPILNDSSRPPVT